MGFEFEDGKPYVMPAHFGPAVEGWDGKIAHYAENTAMTIMFQTEKEALSGLLPPGFRPSDPPVISVSFVMCRGVDFMAGGGYNLVAVNAAADFEGPRNKVSGNFALVLWENHFMPIVVGREVLGAPKLMGEIPDAWTRGGKKGFAVSEDGVLLLEGEVRDMQQASDEELSAIKQQTQGAIWMGWKYIPSCDMKASDVSCATALPANTDIREAWIGSGDVVFHDVPWEKAPLSARAVSALRSLLVVENMGAVMTRGSQDLLIHQQYMIK